MSDETLDTINGPKKPKKEQLVSWKTVLFTFFFGVILPCTFIFFMVRGIESGYWGGKPGHVSGKGIMVWIINRFHLVIIAAVLSTITFVFMLLLKLYEEFTSRILK